MSFDLAGVKPLNVTSLSFSLVGAHWIEGRIGEVALEGWRGLSTPTDCR